MKTKSYLLDPLCIKYSEREAKAAARFLKTLPKLKKNSLKNLEKEIIDMVTQRVTNDTFWKCGMYYLFVTYTGSKNKIAEICISAQAFVDKENEKLNNRDSRG